MIIAAAMTISPQISIMHTKRHFPLTTSFFAIGSRAENTISFASLADWKLWNSPSVTKKTPQSTG